MEQTIGQPVGQTGILRTLNIKKMIKRLLLTSTLLASSALAIQAQDLFLSEGQYYTDESQTTPYTGRYTEFYDDGMLKMELFLKDGRPFISGAAMVKILFLNRNNLHIFRLL